MKQKLTQEKANLTPLYTTLQTPFTPLYWPPPTGTEKRCDLSWASAALPDWWMWEGVWAATLQCFSECCRVLGRPEAAAALPLPGRSVGRTCRLFTAQHARVAGRMLGPADVWTRASHTTHSSLLTGQTLACHHFYSQTLKSSFDGDGIDTAPPDNDIIIFWRDACW